MSLCDSCKYQYYVEQLKPCIIYRDDCEFYEADDFHKEPKIENPSVTHIPSYDMDGVFAEIEKFTRLQREYKEQTLAEIITKYHFIVGSKECKFRLMEMLPEGANIICSPYIESPTTIYAIKKFDVMDLLIGTREREQEPKTGHWITGRSIYHDVEMYRCSECKNWSPYKLEKCPNCHVRMVTESEDK